MERKGLDAYVGFGGCLIYIRMAANADAVYRGDGMIQSNVSRFLKEIEQFQLPVSMNASRELRTLFQRLNEQYEEGGDATLAENDKSNLIDVMRRLETVVMAEIEEKKAFFSSEKRYNTEFLFAQPERIFGEEFFAKLPENAQIDFSEACKCIVLERGTAAAYHLMRGAECALKQLYLSIVKKGRLEKPMWAGMVSKLEERKSLDEALKGTLDNFRKGFRNPVAHPDKFYSIDEAQDLLGTTTQLVGLIVNHNRYEADS